MPVTGHLGISSAHSRADIDEALNAFDDALAEVAA